MRIAYRGNFLPSHSSETHIAASLEAEGHTVIRQQEYCPGYRRQAPGGVRWGDAVQQTLDARADLFWWTCTWHEDIDEGHRALEHLRRLNIPSLAFHLDLYWDLDREALIPTDPFWRTDRCFTADGGNQERFEALGINHTWIRPGVYDVECVSGTPRRQYRADVGFTGSALKYHEEWPNRRELIAFLERSYRGRYRHFGGGKSAVVRGQDLNDALASVKVIVGDSLCFEKQDARYWSDRIYETLGRGGFIIHPRIDALVEEIGDGAVWYDFGDFKQLAGLIDHYVRHNEERMEIAARGQATVKAHSTYRHRVREVLAHMEASV